MAAPGTVGSLQPGTAVVVADRVDALIESVISMSVKEMARLIVDGHRVCTMYRVVPFLGCDVIMLSGTPATCGDTGDVSGR